MYTANEFSHFTKNFGDRRLKLRTGLPVAGGRGISKKKKKKRIKGKQKKKINKKIKKKKKKTKKKSM